MSSATRDLFSIVPVMLVAIGKAAVPARPSMRFPVERTAVWNEF